jgi:hypothetical protein
MKAVCCQIDAIASFMCNLLSNDACYEEDVIVVIAEIRKTERSLTEALDYHWYVEAEKQRLRREREVAQ